MVCAIHEQFKFGNKTSLLNLIKVTGVFSSILSPLQDGVNLGCRFFRIRICQLDGVVEAHRVIVRLHSGEHGVGGGG
jgi:hypothetical protein